MTVNLKELIFDALPPFQSLSSDALAELIANELLKTNLLIVNGKALRVIDYDWRDGSDDDETWEVYTEPRALDVDAD